MNPKNGKPLDNVVVRLFDIKNRKLLDTKISNQKGQFTMLINPGSYVANFSKEGFQNRVIRYTKRKEGYINDKIRLRKIGTVVFEDPNVSK